MLIINGKHFNKETAKEYLNHGGCILTEADYASAVLGYNTASVYIKYLFNKDDNIFPVEHIFDINSRVKIAKGANHIPGNNGRDTVLIEEYGKGKIIILPSELSSLVEDARITRKNFYSQYGEKETNEKVSVVSKGALRYFIQAALEELFRFRKLPFVNLWHFPGDAENVFLFRIDTDFGKKEQVEKLYSVLKKNNINATWFVEVKSCEGWLDYFKEMENQEISLHCYTHKVYPGYENNFNNIKRGIETLKKNNITPEGFAAPYGEWNKNLGKAIGDLTFNYSSEFGYAYDSYPFFPYIENESSSVLQIPIHPVSMGRLHWGGHSEENILNYFYNLTEQKILSQEILVLYTHPFEERFHLLDNIFRNINSKGLPNYTFAEYSNWWKKRDSFSWGAEFPDNLTTRCSQPDKSIFIRVVYPDGNVYLIPSDRTDETYKKINPAQLKLNMKISPGELRKKTLRMMWHDYLSFYRKMKQ